MAKYQMFHEARHARHRTTKGRWQDGYGLYTNIGRTSSWEILFVVQRRTSVEEQCQEIVFVAQRGMMKQSIDGRRGAGH
jgi:hypothetical protein